MKKVVFINQVCKKVKNSLYTFLLDFFKKIGYKIVCKIFFPVCHLRGLELSTSQCKRFKNIFFIHYD